MIIVIGGKCERCGEANPGALDHYLERDNGDRWVTICKNAIHCTRRQHKRQEVTHVR